MTDEQVELIAKAISNIARGGVSGPEGLEYLAMTLGGTEEEGKSVAAALRRIADNLEGLGSLEAAINAMGSESTPFTLDHGVIAFEQTLYDTIAEGFKEVADAIRETKS